MQCSPVVQKMISQIFFSLVVGLGVQAHLTDLLECSPSRNNPSEDCLKPLEAISDVEPGKTIIAKVPCINCPTIDTPGKGNHRITHEENDLLYNISISSDSSELLLNDIPIFPPPLPNLPSHVYATQVHLNFSQASLAATYDCINSVCRNYDGKCACVADSVGVYSLSFHYAARQIKTTVGDTESWLVLFDAMGGHNGYMSDPSVLFHAEGQKMLSVTIQMNDDDTLKILGASLVDREGQFAPGFEPRPLTLWESIRIFFGLQVDNGYDEGHVVYWRNEWGARERKGTIKDILSMVPWSVIAIVVGSLVVGLSLMYGFYWIACTLHLLPRSKGSYSKVGDEEAESSQRKGLLDEEENSNS